MKREWDVCRSFHIAEVFLIYLQIISRASRCLKYSCMRNSHCHIQLNYNAYSSCGLKMCFCCFRGREGREDGDFYFWRDALTVNRRTEKLGKVTKQKQSTGQNWINKKLDMSFFFIWHFSWKHVNYCKLFSGYANSSVKTQAV